MRPARRTRRITSPKDWIAKFKGQFDQGWDKLREETFARQKKLGVDPAERDPDAAPGQHAGLGLARRRGTRSSIAHMAEIYAGFLAYDDANIGRVIDAVEAGRRQLDNTLIIFIEGDNGGSAEGTLQGTANEVAVIGNGAPESFDYLYSIKDGSAARSTITTCRCRGRGPSIRRSSGRSATPRISAARATAW